VVLCALLLSQANIITDLLDFAELKGVSTALRAVEFDIDDAVRSAVRMFTTTVRSKVHTCTSTRSP
jgi:hypothetical protein